MGTTDGYAKTFITYQEGRADTSPPLAQLLRPLSLCISNLIGSLQLFSLGHPSDGLICITVLLLCIFLASGLFHLKLALGELSPQKPCVEPNRSSHPVTMLTRNQRRHWSDVSVYQFSWGRGGPGEEVSLVDRFALGSVQEWLLPLNYSFSKVASNRDLPRLKAQGIFGNPFPVSVPCNHSNKAS